MLGGIYYIFSCKSNPIKYYERLSSNHLVRSRHLYDALLVILYYLTTLLVRIGVLGIMYKKKSGI